MTNTVIYNNLNTAYNNVLNVLDQAKRAALEYEVFISDMNHRTGDGTVVENIDSYFTNLINDEENNN